MIEQTSWRRHDDVGRAPEATLLWTRFDAAIHRDARKVRMVRKALKLVLDLHRKLSRRRKNQHARGACCSGFDEPLHQRQEKGEGLACSGLRAGHQVDAVEHRRIDSALDWRRRLEPAVD